MANERPFQFYSPEQRKKMFVGKTAPEAVSVMLAAFPQVTTVQLLYYSRRIRESQEYLDNFQMTSHQEEVGRRAVLKPGFWNTQRKVLREILISPNLDLSEAEVREYWQDQNEDIFLALVSQVFLKRYKRDVYLPISQKSVEIPGRVHLPLLDFRCSPTHENLELVKRDLKEKGETEGIILKSGNSFHYYGLRLLRHWKWKNWMRQWYWTWADQNYIVHSLSEEYNWLRLERGIAEGTSKPQTPVVVDAI